MSVAQEDETTAVDFPRADEDSRLIRVILVDDHPAICAGLHMSLERFGGIQVLGEAGNGAMAMALALEFKPDIALLDIALPDQDGFETTRRLHDKFPSMRIVLMSGLFNLDRAKRGLAVGANALVLKSEPVQRLGECIHQVNRGNFYCSESIQLMMDADSKSGSSIGGGSHNLSRLSERELKMLVVLAGGASLKQAARAMDISYKSADHLKQDVMKKLQVHDRVELVRIAILEGLL